MAFTINIYYTGSNGSARKFAEEMVGSGVVQEIRNKINLFSNNMCIYGKMVSR